MYLVVILVLSVVLTFPQPPFAWLTGPGLTLGAVALVTLLPPALALGVNRWVLATFEREPANPSAGQFVFGRGLLFIHLLLAIGHSGVLAATNWLDLCAKAAPTWFMIPSLLALAPFVVSVLLVWLALYPADRTVRLLAVEIFLHRGKPLRPAWSLGQYLAFNARHQLFFILVPMLLILAVRDLVVHFDRDLTRWTGSEHAGDVVLGFAAIMVAVIAPELLRHIWVTQRLPDGPLRDRLLLICRRLRLRCREILVWRSGGMIVNAAVMGVIAPLRYVLITDAMLEQLDDQKIEAVFGHEAGHVKRHHIVHFLLFTLISGCLATIFSVQMRRAGLTQYQVSAGLFGALLLFKWGVVFGWISRRFERQADIYGVRTLAWGGLNCALPCHVHHPDGVGQSQPQRDALCATAAHVFSQALHEVAVLNGIRPEARSWRHSSIQSRSQFIQHLAHDPRSLVRFERLVGLVKLLIPLAAIGSAAWAVYAIRLWPAVQKLVARLAG